MEIPDLRRKVEGEEKEGCMVKFITKGIAGKKMGNNLEGEKDR